jgi:hypothetical protein
VPGAVHGLTNEPPVPPDSDRNEARRSPRPPASWLVNSAPALTPTLLTQSLSTLNCSLTHDSMSSKNWNSASSASSLSSAV